MDMRMTQATLAGRDFWGANGVFSPFRSVSRVLRSEMYELDATLRVSRASRSVQGFHKMDFGVRWVAGERGAWGRRHECWMCDA